MFKLWGSCHGISLWESGHFGYIAAELKGKPLLLGRPLRELQSGGKPIATGTDDACLAAYRLLVGGLPPPDPAYRHRG